MFELSASKYIGEGGTILGWRVGWGEDEDEGVQYWQWVDSVLEKVECVEICKMLALAMV